MAFRDKITSYIQAGFGALWVVTHEEERAEKELQAAATDEKLSFWRWSVTQGWVGSDGKAQPAPSPKEALKQILTLQAESMYVLRDFHPYLKNPEVNRTMRDILPPCKSNGRLVVILSPILDIPVELEKDITVVDFNLPTREELKSKLDSVLKAIGENRTDGPKKQPALSNVAAVLDAAAGLTQAEAENEFAFAWSETRGDKPDATGRNSRFDKTAATTVRAGKAGAIKKSGLVEWVEPQFTVDDIGGLANVKSDLAEIAPMFHRSEEAEKFGFLPEDKKVTIALIGVPGSGKSMTAEAISRMLDIGCVRTNFGKIFSAGGGKVGAAENNIEQRNKLVEAMSPCEDWWDEAEKGLSGASGKSEANPWEARVGGALLTWFEAFRARIVVVATINRVGQLPPEMLSRFQYTYFVDLPDEDEAAEIFAIHLRMRNIKLDADKIRALAIKTHGYSGREIRNVVQTAMKMAFARDEKTVSFERIVEAKDRITPLSVSRPEDIAEIRDYAKKHHIRPASGRSDPEMPVAAGRRVR